MKKVRTTTRTGTIDTARRPYETKHRKLAREAASVGFALLRNEHDILPLDRNQKLAPYDAGASKTIKGGTGSDGVNERSSVTVLEGLELTGVEITIKDWIEAFSRGCETSRKTRKEEIWSKGETMPVDDSMKLFFAYSETPYSMPVGPMPDKTNTDTVTYVWSRVAGGGADRYYREGDYLLSEKEARILREVCALYRHVILLISAGGLVKLSILDECPNIEAVLQTVQPGMRGGNAVADILLGKVIPSGKPTDSWALCYEDYPNSGTFSYSSGDVKTKKYEESIYVGYRYFDTFDVPVCHGFEYGKSYTGFTIEVIEIEHFHLRSDCPGIGVKVRVQNTGSRYGGHEVAQVYVSCPQETIPKEYRRLAGPQKTGLLAPGAMEEMVIRFPLSALSSYSEMLPSWMMEPGCYGIFMGNNLRSSTFRASLVLDDTVVLERTMNTYPLQEELKELAAPSETIREKRSRWLDQAGRCPSIHIKDSDVVIGTVEYGTENSRLSKEAVQFMETLTLKQCVRLATGDPGKEQRSNLGSSGISVPGSAAQTSSCVVNSNLASVIPADGPAGLRLSKSYQVEDGVIVPMPFEMTPEDGSLCREKKKPTGETRYRYCTAMPAGTLLAQTQDTGLLTRVGKAIAREMEELRIALWLAPGMDIHRSPLCGRNFEYYSEDPLLTDITATAITEGVQSQPGCGTTIKHSARNSQEGNREDSNTVLLEQTLREVYLKGFEIVIRRSQSMTMMTSYNLINGIRAANCCDLCTRATKDGWSFQGIIMTNWATTHDDPDRTTSSYTRAGNDIVMPGIPADHKNMKGELEAGTLKEEELRRYVARIVKTIWESDQYEKTEE